MIANIHLLLLVLIVIVALLTNGVVQAQIQAHANIFGDSGIKGQLKLTEKSGEVKIVGQLTGLKPGKHGFHIHERNDINCNNNGDHFNPTKVKGFLDIVWTKYLIFKNVGKSWWKRR